MSERNHIEAAMRSSKIIYAVVAVLVVFGIFALGKMNKDEFPQVTIRLGLVVGVYPGATAQEVEEQVKALNVAHTEGQLDALVSFAFNLGITRLRNSTLLKLIREGARKNAIKQEFKRWVYARGRKLHGLELRREWEAKRFFE